MTTTDAEEADLPVQVREIPGQRFLCSRYAGERRGLSQEVDALTRHAVVEGVGPCGPVLVDYSVFTPGDPEEVEVRILVPVRGSTGASEYTLLQEPPMRAACIHYGGLIDPEFDRAHQDLFAWMDANGFPRTGTQHRHVYLAGSAGSENWSIEVRVSLLGGLTGRPAL